MEAADAGLPTERIGRTGIAVAISDPRRVYAVVDSLTPPVPAAVEPPLGAAGDAGGPTVGARPGPQPPPGQGGFFRSDDGGETWTKMSSDQALWGRGWYFEKVTVDPKNADIVYVPNVAVNRSKDGGKTWVALRGSPGGDDYHQAWISPDDSNTMIVASDQGAIITRNATADDPRDGDVELVAQPADGADLSRVGRLPLPVLGDGRAAGQRRGGRALARKVRGHLDARLGADRRRAARAATPPAIRSIPASSTAGPARATISRQISRSRARLRRSHRRPRAPTGRSRSSSRKPIRTRCTTRISSSSRRPTARKPGRRSVPTSRAPIPAFRRRSTRRPPRPPIATASAA